MLKLDHEVNVMNAAEPAIQPIRTMMTYASATQNHLAYLNDTSTETHMLQKHPQVKNLSIKYNTVIPSSTPAERLFSTASLILTKHLNRLSDSLFEKLLLLKANGGI